MEEIPNYSLYGPYKGHYFTIIQLSQMTGISISTLRSRMFRGWTIEQIIETPLSMDRKKKDTIFPVPTYTYNNKEYTVEELAALDACTVPLMTLQGRLHAGWDVRKAVELPYSSGLGKKKEITPATISIAFKKPIQGVFSHMQPKLNKPYLAEIGTYNYDTNKSNYFIIHLENGKTLIVYEDEFQRLD